MDTINFIAANWSSILAALTSVVAGASVIAKLTPTPKDDAILAKVVKVIDFLALNTTRAKVQPIPPAGGTDAP